MPRVRTLNSTLFGAVSAVLAGGFAFIFPRFGLFSLYIAPSQWLLPILGPLLPAQAIAWFGDGPAGGVGVIVACSLLFWTISFAILYFLLGALRFAHKLNAVSR